MQLLVLYRVMLIKRYAIVKLGIPRKLAFVGGLLIAISGVVNAILGAQIGAILYDVYPGGNVGHVGIISGIGALLIGLVILIAVLPLYIQQKRTLIALGGILTVVLGHMGAVWGAIYVGTLALLLYYVSGFWLIAAAIIDFDKKTI
ncbi:MAG: hypothetical protein WBE28_11170 [bacterium]